MRIHDIYNHESIDVLINQHGYEKVSAFLEEHSNELIFQIKHLRDKLSDIKMLMSIEMNTDELRHLKYSHEETKLSIDENLNKLNHTHTLIAQSTYQKLRA